MSNDCACAHCYEEGDADWYCQRGIDKQSKNLEQMIDCANHFRNKFLDALNEIKCLNSEIERLNKIIGGQR